MTINSYGRLKTPPTHPRHQTAEEERISTTDELISTLSLEDKEFMYQQRKIHQHQERLISAYLNVIRDYDFLPKHIVLTCFQNAVKHVYTCIEEQARLENEEAEFCKEADLMVARLKEQR